MSSNQKNIIRWRLALGKYSSKALEDFLPEDINMNLNESDTKDMKKELEQQKKKKSDDKTNELNNSPSEDQKNIENDLNNKEIDRNELILDDPRKYDQVLDFLYGRKEEDERSSEEIIRFDRSIIKEIQNIKNKQGTGDPGHLFAIPEWINNVNKLFPRESAKILTQDAIERYHMTEILTKPEILEELEPSLDLAKTLLSFKSFLNNETMNVAKQLIKKVVDELEEKLRSEIVSVFFGKRNRFQTTNIKIAKNFDFKKTIHRNLKNYDLETNELIIERPIFNSRIKQRHPWHLILLIDQSGSMLDSIIHCAVTSGILSSLKTLKTSIILFDTEIVDLSDIAGDPIEILLSCTLGGGTNIGKALKYGSTLITDYQKTILILLTDFYEGVSTINMFSQLRALKEGGVKLIGLTALTPDANPDYNHEIAQYCMEVGMDILATTPVHLAENIAKIIGI
ncbi:MAG: VWA domain-containing protein [Candidatus Thorarchaeota archaeon]